MSGCVGRGAGERARGGDGGGAWLDDDGRVCRLVVVTCIQALLLNTICLPLPSPSLPIPTASSRLFTPELTPDLYHALTWPELSYVAVDPAGRIVGYILAKMYAFPHHLYPPLTRREEDPSAEPSGHVTSISVLRPYRRLGLANRLMKQSRESSFEFAVQLGTTHPAGRGMDGPG